MRQIETTFDAFGAKLLLIGLKGESNATEILIDCADALEEYQGTMAAMSITSPDGTVYPGDITLDEDGIVHWVVPARDCSIEGHGSARVDLVDDDGTVVASAEATTIIVKTNMQNIAPEQITDWTDAASVALQETRAALVDLIDFDNTAEANEEARQQAESLRVSKENIRNTNEASRQSYESARRTREIERLSAEELRVQAETGRVNAETGRVNAETARVSEFNTIRANAQAALSYIGPSESTSTASAAHAEGTYFTYNGKLYKATAAIAVGDTIADGTNCTQVPGGAMGEVYDLKSGLLISDAKFDYQPELFTLVTGINKLSSYTESKLNSDGSVSPDASFYTSELIDISRFSGTLTAYACTNTTGVPYFGWYYKAFYDYFGEYIQGTYSQTANKDALANATINIPDGAKYVRVCFTKYSAHNSLMLVDGSTAVNYTAYTQQDPENIVLSVKTIDERTKAYNIKSINQLQESTVKTGYYNTSGVFSPTAGFVTFDDLIAIPSGATVVNGYSCNASGSPHNAFYTLVFYDANKEYKSGTRSSSQSNLDNSTCTIPDGACYVRPSFVVTSQGTSYMVTFEDRLYGHDDFNAVDVPYNENLLSLSAEKFSGKRVLVIGDSISTPNYRGVTQTGALLPTWPKWPQVLQKRLGFNLVSDAISASGFLVQPSTTTPGEQSICYRVDTYGDTDNYDYIIIFAGINDWIQGRTIGEVDQTDRTANLSSAVYYTIKTLTDKYPSARILGITPLPTAYYSDPTRNSIDALTEMLISQYEAFGIPCLDMRKMSGFKPGVSSFKEKFTLYANSGGTMTHDGLHPNQAWDNNYLAPVIESFMDRFI